MQAEREKAKAENDKEVYDKAMERRKADPPKEKEPPPAAGTEGDAAAKADL